MIGSLLIVLHAPEEHVIKSVDDVMMFVLKPGFIIYSLFVIGGSLYLIFKVAPKYGKQNVIVYVAICSLLGSMSVMAAKAFGVALKLTIEGNNQLDRFSTYFFAAAVLASALTQINYFNKALDLFSTNIVTPVYYVFFTSATIVASLVLFQGFGEGSTPVSTLSALSGFVIIFIGVFLLSLKAEARKNSFLLQSEPVSGDSRECLKLQVPKANNSLFSNDGLQDIE